MKASEFIVVDIDENKQGMAENDDYDDEEGVPLSQESLRDYSRQEQEIIRYDESTAMDQIGYAARSMGPVVKPIPEIAHLFKAWWSSSDADDMARIKKITRLLQSGAKQLPVWIMVDDFDTFGSPHLLEGFHRFAAALELKLPTVPVCYITVLDKNLSLDEQVVDEWSDTDRGIGTVLKQKGYRKLGSGVDQTAYLEPGTGWILKIFGTRSDAHFTGGTPRFSDDHKMFFKWAKFCMGTDNPFLPRFGGYDSFEWKGKTYLQIRQEPLTRIPARAGNLLEYITDYIEGTRGNSSWSEFSRCYQNLYGRDSPDNNYFVQLLAVMDGDEVATKLFYKTLVSLYKIGAKKNWIWDLHKDNFMMRGKTPVILDPWVVNW